MKKKIIIVKVALGVCFTLKLVERKFTSLCAITGLKRILMIDTHKHVIRY